MTTITPKMQQPPQRDALILSYLNSVDSLLRRYAASARLDYDDLRQDAVLTIMHCLEVQPNAANPRAYISRSVRNRIIDKIRYNQCRRAVSLDALCDTCSTLSDLFPSDEREPGAALATREEFQAFSAFLLTNKARLLPSSTRRMYRELVDTALASLSLDSQEVQP